MGYQPNAVVAFSRGQEESLLLAEACEAYYKSCIEGLRSGQLRQDGEYIIYVLGHREYSATVGVETDTESDLGFHGVRWYESDWGRFLSVDKLWEKYASFTPYHYAANSPLVLFDFTGLGVDDVRRMSAAVNTQLMQIYNDNAQHLRTTGQSRETSANIYTGFVVGDVATRDGNTSSFNAYEAGTANMREGLIGGMHDHSQNDEIGSNETFTGVPPGGEDIFAVGMLAVDDPVKAQGYIMLVESGSARFAIEIANAELAGNYFGSIERDALAASILEGTEYSRNVNKVITNNLRRLFGDGSKGIIIYKANDDNRIEWEQLD